MQLTFSGHDSFHCRQFWLKKGFDFIDEGKKFTDSDASIHLGVGKNMVASIRHWLKAFGITDNNDALTGFAYRLLSDDGWDPFLEDQGSLWLLHYKLLKSNYASIYRIIFSELSNERPDFTVDHFISYVLDTKGVYNENTLKRDFTAFYRNYFGKMNKGDIEESFTGILTELHVLSEKRKSHLNGKGKEEERSFWNLEKAVRDDVPSHILLFAIVDNENFGSSVSFENLYRDALGISNVFRLNREGVTRALESLQSAFPKDIVFSNEAGVRELQFKAKPEPFELLEQYYNEN